MFLREMLLLSTLTVAMGFHSFTASTRLAALLNDRRIEQAVNVYIAEQEKHITKIKTVLTKLDELVTRYHNYSLAHPIAAFKFISVCSQLHSLISANESLKRYTEQVEGVAVPSHADLLGAASNIENIRSVYQLSHDDVIAGKVFGRRAVPLEPDDVYFVGDTLFSKRNLHRAVPWLEKSIAMVGSKVRADTVNSKLARCYEQDNDIRSLQKKVTAMKQDGLPLETLSNYVAYLDTLLAHTRVPVRMSNDSDMETYASLCRNAHRTVHDSGRIRCRYTSRLVPFMRVKQEVLSNSPYVVFYHDVINDRENAVLTNISRRSLSANYGSPRAEVSDTQSTDRPHNHVVWLNGSGLLPRITKRISQITGLHAQNDVGIYQVADYGVGGFDFPLVETTKSNDTINGVRYVRNTGMASFVLYLQVPKAGGSRVFNRAGLTFDGVKNGIMMWYNQLASGDADWTSMQSICPVIHGSLLVMKKWFDASEQMFARPCGLRRFPFTSLKPSSTAAY